MKDVFYFVHLLNDFSGSPRVLAQAVDAIKEDNKCTIITSQHKGFLYGLEGTTKMTVPYHNSSNRFITLVNYSIAQIITFLLLSVLLIKGRIKQERSIVVCNTLLPFGANLAAKLFANRLVCYVHEASITPKPLLYFLTKISSVCADELVFVSNYVRDFHKDWAFKLRSTVIYNSFSSDFIQHSEPCNNSPCKKFESQSILFVGSLKLYKGIDTFVTLAESLPEYSFTAVLNAEEGEFSFFKKQHQHLHNLTMLCRPNDLPDLYRNHTLLVNLSKPKEWVETFALTLIEAMVCATPVIAPNIGGPLEVVQNESGYTVDVSDLDQVIRHVTLLLNDKHKWLHAAQNAHTQSLRFSPCVYMQKIRTLLLNRVLIK